MCSVWVCVCVCVCVWWEGGERERQRDERSTDKSFTLSAECLPPSDKGTPR